MNTGARVLVRAGGIPLPKVQKIQLRRIKASRNETQEDADVVVDEIQVDPNLVAQNVTLHTVTPGGVCTPFQYHSEYGTVSNSPRLLPGSYQVTATAMINGKKKNKTATFTVTTCDFNPTVVIDF